MSYASGKGDALGRYYTKLEVARGVVNWLPFLEPGSRVLEPSAGGGAFLEALHERDALEDLGLYLHALDVDATAPALLGEGLPYVHRIGDFLDPGTIEGWERPDLVIGNPPYSVNRQEVARLHVERALQATRRHVVFVLRVGFLAWTGKALDDPAGRASWWPLRRPRAVMHLTPRPTFTGSGTDASEYAAYWWDLEHSMDQPGPFSYDWIPWGRFAP